MSKTHIVSFDLSALTLAYTAAATYHVAFDAFCADMVQWHAAGAYPTNGQVKAALTAADKGLKPGSVSVYACNILKWARSGKTPANMRQCVNKSPEGHVKAAAGRPAGKGAGKTTATAAAESAAANDSSIIPKDGVSPMHRWAVALTAMDSGALIVRNAANNTMTAEDATAFQKLIKDALAIVGKYTAKTATK